MTTECQFFRAADGGALTGDKSECQGIRAFCPHHPAQQEDTAHIPDGRHEAHNFGGKP